MKKQLLSLLAAAVFWAPCFAHADPAPTSTATAQNLWKPKVLKEKLGLTDDQMTKIKSDFASRRESRHAGASQARQARARLQEAVRNNSSESEIRAAANTVGAALGELGVPRASLFAAIKPILTPEQLAKLDALSAAH